MAELFALLPIFKAIPLDAVKPIATSPVGFISIALFQVIALPAVPAGATK